MASKRVIVAVTNDLLYDQRVRRICHTLAGNGYRVLLTGRKLRNSKPLEHLPFKQSRLTTIFRSGPLFYIEYNIRLLTLLLTTRCDIIVPVDTDTMAACATAAVLKRSSLVFDSHELFTGVPELKRRPVVKSIWRAVERITVRAADLTITVSPQLAAELEKVHKRRFEVILNTPHLKGDSRKKTGLRDGPPLIIYQGVLNRGRGLHEAIEAIGDTRANLVIVGEGVLRKDLERAAAPLIAEGRVIFRGWLDREQMEAETAMAMAGLNILDDESLSYRLSLSNKFFNYIHAGIPQITAPFPSYIEINNRWQVALTCQCDPAEIAGAINKLTESAPLRERLEENCRQAALHLNWQSEEVRLLSLFGKL